MRISFFFLLAKSGYYQLMHSEHLLCTRHSAGILHPRRGGLSFPILQMRKSRVGPRLCLQGAELGWRRDAWTLALRLLRASSQGQAEAGPWIS